MTGSSCGIGRAIALSFHHEGARVVCADIRETAVDSGDCADDDDNGDTTHGRIDATFIRTDVTNAEDMARLVRRTVELYGRLDVFVEPILRSTMKADLKLLSADSSIMPGSIEIQASNSPYGLLMKTPSTSSTGSTQRASSWDVSMHRLRCEYKSPIAMAIEGGSSPLVRSLDLSGQRMPLATVLPRGPSTP